MIRAKLQCIVVKDRAMNLLSQANTTTCSEMRSVVIRWSIFHELGTHRYSAHTYWFDRVRCDTSVFSKEALQTTTRLS